MFELVERYIECAGNALYANFILTANIEQYMPFYGQVGICFCHVYL